MGEQVALPERETPEHPSGPSLQAEGEGDWQGQVCDPSRHPPHKSPPNWSRDWIEHLTLSLFCSLFLHYRLLGNFLRATTNAESAALGATLLLAYATAVKASGLHFSDFNPYFHLVSVVVGSDGKDVATIAIRMTNPFVGPIDRESESAPLLMRRAKTMLPILESSLTNSQEILATTVTVSTTATTVATTNRSRRLQG